MKQEILYIDATPTIDYPLRILKAYRAMGNTRWSSTSTEITENNPLVAQMNEWQNQRNALLDKAIEILSAQLQAVINE